jgi:2-phospho-L-lactate/phosphoenolpyruvate guanylyltransferase
MSAGTIRGVWAAVPVKTFSAAKNRLAPLLTPAQRSALAAAMLEDVLSALAAAPVSGIMVNTEDAEAVSLAQRFGAVVVCEDAQDGHTTAVAALARILASRGASAMLALPGDIPGVTTPELERVCAAGQRPPPAFTIVPSHDERGSNAVLVAPPQAVPLRFGDDSFYPHLDAARRCGIEPVVVRLPGIALDIDRPDDVRALLRATPRLPSRAARLLKEMRLLTPR